MGSYFHVIERKVGGNLDAFRRELGRLRESGHFHRDRHERIMRIAQTVGFGHIVRVRVPALGDARLLPQSERYTEGRGYLAIKGKD